jgi:hypothetical protein
LTPQRVTFTAGRIAPARAFSARRGVARGLRGLRPLRGDVEIPLILRLSLVGRASALVGRASDAVGWVSAAAGWVSAAGGLVSAAAGRVSAAAGRASDGGVFNWHPLRLVAGECIYATHGGARAAKE